ncbi:protein FAM214B-like [Brienomyrus brachyistius]|uniref:protein FAM214B-like n=1 Tax=Brienomyrus brachyistius TaxID=42636 RepID=UPI0020B2224C|nr:protein FAM214B-like [Brienomyrus brachyistius]
MRHIHVDIARKEAPVELPEQQGDLPSSNGVMVAAGTRHTLTRPFGDEEIKLQKVYQLSIFSQMGRFSEVSEEQRILRPGMKRGLEGPLQSCKRPHLEGEYTEVKSTYESPVEVLEGEILCGQHFSCTATHLIEHTDGVPTQACSQPALPNIPLKHPTQHNQNGLVPNAQTTHSSGNKLLAVDSVQLRSPVSQTFLARNTAQSVCAMPDCTLGDLGTEGCIKRGSAEPQLPSNAELTDQAFGVPALSITSDLQRHFELRDMQANRESSPLKSNGLQAVHTNGLASSEKTPVSLPIPSSSLSTPSTCSARKKLLSSSDTGESCSEDEGPSTSKRSRRGLQAPGLCLGAFRSTDAKAAPFWNHLLPSTQEQPKSSSNCSKVGSRLKSSIRLKSRQLRSGRRREISSPSRSSWPSVSISRSLLGNFEESILKGRFSPSGQIEGFTAEIGASGSYFPQHATLPVQVTYYDISEHSAPSPFLGVIYLEALGKKGYSIPKAGTLQVTLFNPNKTVVKMFLVTYDFGDMPVNHMTFLRHRIFLVPVEEAEGQVANVEGTAMDRKKILCYLMHLRFQSSKSGKIYLHDNIRLLFSRKSIEVDTGIPYELKSFTEVPKNPKYSPRM